jgi:hypothetical protein
MLTLRSMAAINGEGHLGRRSRHGGRLDDGRARGWTVREGAARPLRREKAYVEALEDAEVDVGWTT